jgi:hypothetical protein
MLVGWHSTIHSAAAVLFCVVHPQSDFPRKYEPQKRGRPRVTALAENGAFACLWGYQKMCSIAPVQDLCADDARARAYRPALNSLIKKRKIVVQKNIFSVHRFI